MTHGDPAKGGAARRRGAEDRPPGTAAGLRLPRQGEEGRQAVLRLVRPDDAALAAQPAGATAREVQGQDASRSTSRSTGRCASGSTRPWASCSRSWRRTARRRTRSSSTCTTTAGFRTRTRRTIAPKSKRSPYDGGLRTPIIVKWPGHVKPGVERAARVSRSTSRRRSSRRPARSPRPTCRASTCSTRTGSRAADRDLRRGLRAQRGGHPQARREPAIPLGVEGNWKLIVPHEPNVKGGKPELYDLAKDPTETDEPGDEASGPGERSDEEARCVVEAVNRMGVRMPP